jgi:ribosome-associated protein
MSAARKVPRGKRRARPEALPPSIEKAVQVIDDLKATDVLVLDLRRVATFTDYLVICTGSSDRHVQAVVDGIRDRLRELDVTPLHTEGYERAAWVLVDFVDFLVNVFTPETRAFYQLERVWRDAPVLVGARPEHPAEEAPESGGEGEPGAADG